VLELVASMIESFSSERPQRSSLMLWAMASARNTRAPLS